MKIINKKWFFIGILLSVGFILCICCAGCTKHSAINKDIFIEKSMNNGYSTYDITASGKQQSASDLKSSINSVTLAGTKNDEYKEMHIEFWDLSNNDIASFYWNNNSEKLQKYTNVHTSISNENYKNYEQTNSDGVFYRLVQVDNTFIYSHCYSNKKDDLNHFIAEIGY